MPVQRAGRLATTATVAAGRDGERTSGRNRRSPAQRAAAGKAARAMVPLGAHADFRATASRDPVGLVLKQDETRVPDLVPIRHARMAVSPFTFYRGAAVVMAADLHTTPTTDVRAQLCGDAHLSNFGAYASPERRLVFDINDFDETLPGPFEWDVKRLAASLVVAGRDNGFSRKECRKVTRAGMESYRTAMRAFAAQPILAVWYAHLNIEEALADYESALTRRELKRQKANLKSTQGQFAKARTRDSLQAIGKLTCMVGGQRRIASDPPLLVPIDQLTGFDIDVVLAGIRDLLAAYQGTVRSDLRHLLDGFALADVAHKVVGVGSVGTRAWIVLLQAGSDEEGLLLQAKQAAPSVLAAYAGASEYVNQAQRVVAGQHLMQAASDIFLGWLRVRTGGRDEDYYVRQLRDWKLSAAIEQMGPHRMEVYARFCGWTLARAHARSGDRIAISAYLGNSTKFDDALADFAETYADQNERDHAAFTAAIAAGRVEATAALM